MLDIYLHVEDSTIESMFRHQVSQEKWLLKACNHTDNRLVWDDEWEAHKSRGESILDQNRTWIVVREKGVYLVYVQANFELKPQKDTEKLNLLVELNYGEKTEIFTAAHDTRVVNGNTSIDAKLNTFLLMYMQSTNQLSVRAYPSNLVNYNARPFSTFITIIKWADDW
ncbi:uncharacterized protein si:dkey-220k22.3 isoform X2 [Megalobrama amblycephala]|uniref:uncharacterized protein si:dkey-220k22.3 isoform X2 n=1 Tax=Megalobrama amblycephala TaxID=75352 RepID=UPI0020147A95|nr:uncharacterized protein si:dkey-220k22.3 isoform X2 [Megalobrama amblycephala]